MDEIESVYSMRDKPDPRKEDLIAKSRGHIIDYCDPDTGIIRISEEIQKDGAEWWYDDYIDADGDGYSRPHRLGGPAGRFKDDRYQIWYYHGQQVDVKSQKEYEQWLRLKAFA